MKHIIAILWKQIKDTFKNKEILIQFVMFPALTLIMEKAITIEGMPEHFFTNLFGVMYVGMAPLTSMASIISEEKEKIAAEGSDNMSDDEWADMIQNIANKKRENKIERDKNG